MLLECVLISGMSVLFCVAEPVVEDTLAVIQMQGARRVQVSSQGMETTFLGNWGNDLSVYWQARGIAHLAGIEFGLPGWPKVHFDHNSFLQYLPLHHQPIPALTNRRALEVADAACPHECHECYDPKWFQRYPHECTGAWTYIRPEIQMDTQAALDKVFNENAIVPPKFLPGDVVLHLRLEFEHPQQAWPGRSVFANHLPSRTKRIRIVHQPYKDEHFRAWEPSTINGGIHQNYSVEQQHNISILLRGYKEMLSDVCGGCTVIAETDSQLADFAKIARAPVVFGTGSTYGFWAAVSNKVGKVYMTPDYFAGGRKPDLGEHWHWFRGNLLGNSLVQNFRRVSPERLVDWIKNN